MSLPRPLKQVLRETPQDAAVVRTWVRLQRTRRGSNRRLLPWLVSATLLAAVVVALSWPEPAPTSSVSTLLARGRQQAPTRATQATRVLSTSVVAEPPKVAPPPDVVAALIESAAEAVRAKDHERAAALLSEIRHHEDDSRAPTVLIALGRIQLESLHRRADAARSFTRALELGPPEDLVVPTWRALEQAQR